MTEADTEALAPRGPTRVQRFARGAVVAAFAVAALGGAIVGVRNRERDDAFVERQLHPVVVAPGDVDAAVAHTLRARSVACTGDNTGGALRNPWSCTVRGRSGRTSRFTLFVDERGAYDAGGARRFHGCCVPVPKL